MSLPEVRTLLQGPWGAGDPVPEPHTTFPPFNDAYVSAQDQAAPTAKASAAGISTRIGRADYSLDRSDQNQIAKIY